MQRLDYEAVLFLDKSPLYWFAFLTFEEFIKLEEDGELNTTVVDSPFRMVSD